MNRIFKNILWINLCIVAYHCLLVHCQADFTCSQPNRGELIHYQNEPRNITIHWRIESVCSTYVQCFGFQPNGDVNEHVQLCPVEIQPNDRVFIVPPPEDSPYAMKPINVSYEEFLSCPGADTPMGQRLYSENSTADIIEIPREWLVAGSTIYIAQLQNGAFSNCDIGLRVQILIKEVNCPTTETLPNNGDISTGDEVCSGNGVCATEILSPFYSCYCNESFSGSDCSIRNACASSPCAEGATCLAEDATDSFECLCPDFKTGPLCADVIDTCVSDPCQNGGLCSYDDTGYSCECPFGYHGRNCRRVRRRCDDFPDICQHGG